MSLVTSDQSMPLASFVSFVFDRTEENKVAYKPAPCNLVTLSLAEFFFNTTIENCCYKYEPKIRTIVAVNCTLGIFLLEHWTSLSHTSLPPLQVLLRYVSFSKTPPCPTLKNVRSLGRIGSTRAHLWSGGGGVISYMCHMEMCRQSQYTFWPSNRRQGELF